MLNYFYFYGRASILIFIYYKQILFIVLQNHFAHVEFALYA